MSATEVKNQLRVYHDPFSGATSQPKIPDGKCTHSLGFSTQSVSEINNKATNSDMHLLLYPGMNSALCILGSDQAELGDRNYFIPEFLRSGTIDWSGGIGGTTFPLTNSDGYAKWRIVSCGVQLKLLNSVEKDDGWWEACRVNEAVTHSQWWMTTTNNGTGTEIDTLGTISPVSLLSELADRQIANEPSYMTGLLRDLNKVQFELHPITDDHDFTTCKDPLIVEGSDYTYNAGTVDARFDRGSPTVYNLIENFVDFSHDMVYIRLHCRPNATDGGSRFHCNIVSNQEIVYDTNDRLARYQTRSMNIGDGNMGAHQEVRRGAGGAANLIP